jgi:hypothetical protein
MAMMYPWYGLKRTNLISLTLLDLSTASRYWDPKPGMYVSISTTLACNMQTELFRKTACFQCLLHDWGSPFW